MNDLVERLRDIKAGDSVTLACELDDLCQEAADALTAKDKEIEALRDAAEVYDTEIRLWKIELDGKLGVAEARAETAERERDEARAALKPFAASARGLEITIAQLDAARAVIKQGDKP